MVGFLDFRNRFIELGCFCLNNIRAVYPGCQQNNIVRWTKKGLLIQLRQSWYTFPECLKIPDFERYISCRIYNLAAFFILIW